MPDFAATLSVAWSSGPEADIAGYRLRYGTIPGAPTSQIDSGGLTQCTVPGLAAGVAYYFSLVAYDASGNDSAPSPEIEALIPASGASPSIDAVIEATTGSMYLMRGWGTSVRLVGSHLQAGATVSMGSGVLPSATSPDGADLTLRVIVGSQAAPGPRTVVVTNPDGGIGGGMDLVTVVRTPDVNNDCRIDAFDLNELARAWNSSRGDADYADVIDFDGDGTIGPDDLTIFVKYFGRPIQGCP